MARDYAPVIAGLLANAEDERLPEAARDSYRAKAERLMREYRIAEESALATDITAAAPITRVIRLYDGYPQMAAYYGMVLGAIMTHTGCRYLYTGNGEATVVGYAGDVRYAEFLWTAARLMFATRIDPRWDDTLPLEENVWRLRNAGIERRVIADRAWGNGAVAAARSRVQRIYIRECASRGETPRAAGLGHQTATYRQAYAQSFYDTMVQRLRTARDAADSTHGALDLHDRKYRVAEAFYVAFPHMRPSTEPVPAPEPCDACKRAASGTCRAHTYRWTKADAVRYDRMTNSASAQAGTANGRAAAEGVVIDRGARAGRLED